MLAAHRPFVAENLELIGDHATNIAEVVESQITGDPLSGRADPTGTRWRSADGRSSAPLTLMMPRLHATRRADALAIVS